ncbi:unnamed protein product [Lactuca saligna]|uniref:Uncharacterized protein n=1 Tax=Lactuca saligna TaxID=75948 RepID=A0AA35ZR18_LACSI|nr:unnamed protein product [Lactuca saligna]
MHWIMAQARFFLLGSKADRFYGSNYRPRPELLDSALMRPGRFSRKVVVGKPDEDGRRKIFALYLQKVPMEEDKQVICDLVASCTLGLVGVDIENIANEAVVLVARRGLC